MTTVESTETKRGGCLTAFLIFMLVVSPLYVLTALIPMSEQTRELLPNWPQWAVLTMGLLGLANFVFALAAWKWKKWGVYGLAVAAVAFFALGATRGALQIYSAVFGIAISMAILTRLVRPVWQRMK